MLFDVWRDSDFSVTTIIAASETAARNIFAIRHGYSSDDIGYREFCDSLNVRKVY